MGASLLALFLFILFLLEWPRLIDRLGPPEKDTDLLSAEIRLARFRAGEQPWLDSENKK